MRVVNKTDLLHALVVTSREPPTPEMVLVVRGTFGFDEAGVIVPLEGVPQQVQGFLCADTFGDEDEERSGQLVRASDFAQFKPRAEVLVYGSCHPQGRVAQCDVQIAVGNWGKSLRVSGTRRWTNDGKPSQPDLFETMPLDFTHAFGGPGLPPAEGEEPVPHPDNPIGKGFGDGRLPNVELAEDLITDRESSPKPGGLGPINPSWPLRAGKQGTKYGGNYARTRAPYYAEDFDWTYFMAAPRDQWVSGSLKGDEKLTATNLLASHPELDSKLPALRVRCFVLDEQARFREVPMVLDTVALDTDDEQVSLTWRGLDAVRERDLADVTFVLIVHERLTDAPLPLEHYRQEMAAIEADPVGFERMRAEALESVEAIEGADPMSQWVLEKGLPMPPEFQKQLGSVYKQLADDGVDMEAKLAELKELHAAPPDEPPPAMLPFPEGRPRLFLRPQFKELRERIAFARARMPTGAEAPGSLLEMEQKLNDPKMLEVDPTLIAETNGEPGPEADLTGQDLSGRDFSGVDLHGAKLDGCVCIGTIFDAANLTGASLQGAMLFKARFKSAALSGANLSKCNAAYASFELADLSDTTLDEGYFANADLSGASLEGARGKVVSFLEAKLSNVRASGIQLSRSSFEKAVIDGACFDEADFDDCRFHNSEGAGCSFAGAKLLEGVFNEAKLSGVSFAGAALDRSKWLDAELTDADLSNVVAHDSHFTGAVLTRARFVKADLRAARFYRCNLEQVDFTRSNLHEADLTKAKLNKTLFVKANLYDAKLIEAKGPDVDFSGANLKRCIYEGRA
jgi:uncharacterized protein YjbI with pentapeptide repeats